MVRTSTIESAVMLAVFLAVISIHCGRYLKRAAQSMNPA